jgi:uncharacterized membrane protein
MGTPTPWGRWFLALAIPFGLFLAVARPPMQELDAPYHLPRVHRIANGTFVEPIGPDGRVEPIIDACLHGFMTQHGERARGDQPLDFRGNWSEKDCTTPVRWGMPNAAVTSPIPYLPGVLGYRTADLLGGGLNVRFLAARLTFLATYIATVWTAIRLAPRGRALLFAVAVLPSSLALAASITADGTAIWAAILAVALALRARESPSRRLFVALAAVLVVLAVSKNLYGPFVLLLLLVPAAAFRDAGDRLRRVTLGTLAVFIPAALWATYASGVHYDFFSVDSEASRERILDDPIAFLRAAWNGLWDPFVREVTLPGFVEVLGGQRPTRTEHLFGDLAPPALIAAAAVLLVAAVLADPGPPTAPDRRRRVVTLLVCAAIVAATTLLVYVGVALTANPPGSDSLVWVQGRYFLPLIPLGVFAAGRRVPWQPWLARLVPLGSAGLLGWLSWRVYVLFYAP